ILGGGTNDTIGLILSGSVVTQENGGTVANVETFSLDLGGGTDTVGFTGTGQDLIDKLATPTATGFATFNGVENVTGGRAHDELTGSSAANTLIGGGGNDSLIGGGGSDWLTGGTGADHFVFNAQADGMDHIVDFTLGTDSLDFLHGSGTLFGNGLATGGANTGTLAANHFVSGTTEGSFGAAG